MHVDQNMHFFINKIEAISSALFLLFGLNVSNDPLTRHSYLGQKWENSGIRVLLN